MQVVQVQTVPGNPGFIEVARPGRKSDMQGGGMKLTKENTMKKGHRWHQPSRLPSPEELGKHVGEWVAIVNRRVVASGKDPIQVRDEGRSKSHHEPFMMHIPAGNMLL
jgi:hypothetical protein